MAWHVVADDLSGAAEVAAALTALAPFAPLAARDFDGADSGSVGFPGSLGLPLPTGANAVAQSAQAAADRFASAATIAHSAHDAQHPFRLVSQIRLVTDAGFGASGASGASAASAAEVEGVADLDGIDFDVVDTDNRGRTAADAAARMLALLETIDPASPLFLKFDSLLRGNIGSELASVAASRSVVFCPAVPGNGRTVLDGVLQIAGVPLHQTTLWAAEGRGAAATIREQLGSVASTPVSLDDVRSESLGAVLAAVAASGAIAVCDAQTDSDLARIAAAAVAHGFALAGAAGLASAVAELALAATSSSSSSSSSPVSSSTSVRVAGVASAGTLFLLGTASPAAAAQVLRLELDGTPVLRLSLKELRNTHIPTSGDVAVIVSAPLDPTQSGEIVAELAALAIRSEAGRNLVLSGGETARAVLDALGIVHLSPLSQPHQGAVISLAAGGRLVATRPGSYGDAASLVTILAEIHLLTAGLGAAAARRGASPQFSPQHPLTTDRKALA